MAIAQLLERSERMEASNLGCPSDSSLLVGRSSAEPFLSGSLTKDSLTFRADRQRTSTLRTSCSSGTRDGIGGSWRLAEHRPSAVTVEPKDGFELDGN